MNAPSFALARAAPPARVRAPLALAIALLALIPAARGQTTLSGIVPLPEAPPAAVMAKRYEIVSRGGVLSTVPPVAVVWLEGPAAAAAKAEDAPAMAEIAQRGFVFEPALLAVRKGTTVAFPNYDDEYHNVFSYSPAKRFDLGRYLPEEMPAPTQVFDQTGPVVLRCDIHEHMKAIILVVDSAYFKTTDTDGRFELPAVPAGEFVLKAWVNSKTTLEKRIQVTAGQSALDVSF